MQNNYGTLFICATPIGNLSDITQRALSTLSTVDIVLCEDTRISKHIFSHHGIKYNKLIALHEHNEVEISQQVLIWLRNGLNICQISDAGTPGISDPGARLCNIARQNGFRVSPIPGANAYISLLSVSGIQSSSLFYGFLPPQNNQQKIELLKWQHTDYAIGIYESPHRIISTLKNIIQTLGTNREILMGREITKQFETIIKLQAQKLLEFIESDNNQTKGEFCLIIYPPIINKIAQDNLTEDQIKILKLLLPELPPKKAVSITHKITGANKDLLYNYTLANK